MYGYVTHLPEKKPQKDSWCASCIKPANYFSVARNWMIFVTNIFQQLGNLFGAPETI